MIKSSKVELEVSSKQTKVSKNLECRTDIFEHNDNNLVGQGRPWWMLSRSKIYKVSQSQ